MKLGDVAERVISAGRRNVIVQRQLFHCSTVYSLFLVLIKCEVIRQILMLALFLGFLMCAVSVCIAMKIDLMLYNVVVLFWQKIMFIPIYKHFCFVGILKWRWSLTIRWYVCSFASYSKKKKHLVNSDVIYISNVFFGNAEHLE